VNGPLPLPDGWTMRELPQVELLLPPDGPRVVEALPAEGAVPVGVLVREDGSPLRLNDATDSDAFLRDVAPRLSPLAVALTLVRYRIATVLGQPTVRLATGPGDLHPSLRERGLPLDLAVDGDRIAFTTGFADAWTGRAGADRWTVVRGAGAALHGEPSAREETG
jgi:hypothetical protein